MGCGSDGAGSYPEIGLDQEARVLLFVLLREALASETANWG